MNQNKWVPSAAPIWSQPAWVDQVKDWISAVLTREGLAITGPIEQVQERPWSIVLRLPSESVDVYFKACAPVLAHEAAITAALYRWHPAYIPPVLDADPDRGWLLMADGGRTLRQAFRHDRSRTAPTIESWRAILGLYATLQIDLADHVTELLQLGAPDRRLSLLLHLYQDLLAGQEYLLIDQPDGLTASEYQRLLAAAPRVADLCQELAHYAIPMSLHHNDLHDANIFFAGSRPRFFDWGDSSVAHPFFSLRTVFVSIENSFGLAEDDPFFAGLAQDYLRPWAMLASNEDLTAAFALAQRLWSLSSAVKYKRLLRHLPVLKEEYGSAVPSLLQEFLAVNPQF